MNIGKLVCIFLQYSCVLLSMSSFALFSGFPSSTSAKAILVKQKNNHVGKLDKTARGNPLTVMDDLTNKELFMLFAPSVTVSIGNRPQFQRHKQSLPLIPDMTILELLVAAVKKTSDDKNHTRNQHHESDTESNGSEHPKNSHHKSPFDVVIHWDNSLGCFSVFKALGTENDDLYAWRFNIQNRHQKVIYKGHCLPSQEDITLRPSDRVSISYLRSVKKSKSRSRSHTRSKAYSNWSRL